MANTKLQNLPVIATDLVNKYKAAGAELLGCKEYGAAYEAAKEIFGRQVYSDTDLALIYIKSLFVSLTIHLSGNETKFWVHTGHLAEQRFRVFDAETLVWYLLYRAGEEKLINSIHG